MCWIKVTNDALPSPEPDRSRRPRRQMLCVCRARGCPTSSLDSPHPRHERGSRTRASPTLEHCPLLDCQRESSASGQQVFCRSVPCRPPRQRQARRVLPARPERDPRTPQSQGRSAFHRVRPRSPWPTNVSKTPARGSSASCEPEDTHASRSPTPASPRCTYSTPSHPAEI